jgi:hypothetical protein
MTTSLMPESSSLKSLKLFQGILESSEAQYRDIAIGNRDAVIEEIIAEIRGAGVKKKLVEVLGDDSTLQKVSVYGFMVV